MSHSLLLHGSLHDTSPTSHIANMGKMSNFLEPWVHLLDIDVLEDSRFIFTEDNEIVIMTKLQIVQMLQYAMDCCKDLQLHTVFKQYEKLLCEDTTESPQRFHASLSPKSGGEVSLFLFLFLSLTISRSLLCASCYLLLILSL